MYQQDPESQISQMSTQDIMSLMAELQGQDPSIQQQAGGMGGFQQGQGNMYQGNPATDPAVAFIAPFQIDQDKKDKFFSLTPELQQEIMSQGGLEKARDPTAVLVSRIARSITSARTEGRTINTPQKIGPRPGDWYCSICNDLQFAKNDVCRMCNTPRSMADTGEAPKLDAVQWVSMFAIEEDKKLQFLNMSADHQEKIIGQGTLHGARDPTAVLVSRMGKARQGVFDNLPSNTFSAVPAHQPGPYNNIKAPTGTLKIMGGSSFGPATSGGSGKGGAGSGKGSETEDLAWAAYAKGFMLAMKGKGKDDGKSSSYDSSWDSSWY